MVAHQSTSTAHHPDDFWLCHYFDNLPTDDCPAELRPILNADFSSTLRRPLCAQILRHALASTDASSLPAEHRSSADALVLAIAALQTFVLENFLGPRTDDSEYASFPHYELLHDSVDVAALLAIDGEPINENVARPELLLIARTLLVAFQPDDAQLSRIAHWWLLRLLYVHQQIIDEPVGTLHAEFQRIADALLATELTASPSSVALLRLEIAQAHLAYRRAWRAQPHIERARDALGVQLSVQGFLGRRTKWQQKALPQLALRVHPDTDDGERSAERTHASGTLPSLLRLDDDTRLERITFESADDNRALRLSAPVQLLVLGQLHCQLRSQPHDQLADEQLVPYLTTLLQQSHGPWTVRAFALLQNIALEASHKRTVERSLKQCEELVRLLSVRSTDDDTDADARATAAQRLSLAYGAYVRPRWHVQSQLGALLVSLGMVKTALQLYGQLRQWTEVIACYTLLEQRSKAAAVIEQELAKRPSVELLCLLGDARDDPQCYERAWTLSGERSGRAQRHWGCWHFARREYAEAIPHLQRSLALNALQENVWARLGYAALQLERWPLAAEAYRRYTAIEPNGFECWNNLSKAYVQMGDKTRAHKVLQEALKCNYSNWKVWDNYLVVSVDTGHFEDALNAYERLVELRERHWDAAVLRIVCRAVTDGRTTDAEGRPAARLLRKARKLIGHLAVLYAADALVWDLAAQLYAADEPLTEAQHLQKAFRCATQTRTESPWSTDPASVDAVLGLCERLCAASRRAWAQRSAPDGRQAACTSQLSSARLSVQGAIRAASDGGWPEHSGRIEALREQLEEIRALLLEQ